MNKIIKNFSILLMVTILLISSLSVYASTLTYSYSLRQLSGVPASSNVYRESYYFSATGTSTIVTCTQNTTSGASVTVVSSNGIMALLNTAGASASAQSVPGDVYTVSVSLSVPDSYNTYTGYGTVII